MNNGFELVELQFPKDSLLKKTLVKFIKIIQTAPGPFYVHCHGGNHRAGVLAAYYRVKEENWSYEKAVIEFGYLGGDLKEDYPMLRSIE